MEWRNQWQWHNQMAAAAAGSQRQPGGMPGGLAAYRRVAKNEDGVK